MVNIYRLILLFTFCFASSVSFSFPAITSSSSWGFTASDGGAHGGYSSSYAAYTACVANGTCIGGGYLSGACTDVCYYTNGYYGVGMVTDYYPGSTSCPSNSTLSGSSCSCNSGYYTGSDGASCTALTTSSANDAACIAKPPSSTNAVSVGGTFNPITTPVCVGGCAYQATDGRSFLNAAGQTVTLSTIQGQSSVGSCAGVTGNIPAVSSNQGVTPDSCTANGQGFISNGVNTVCVPSGTGQTTSNAASGVAPAANVPAVDPQNAPAAASSVQAADGAANGSAAAVAIGVAAGIQSQAFCLQNPQSMICQSGSFAGTCAGTPSCSGDAVFCSMAISEFRTQCELASIASSVAVDPFSSEMGIYNGVKAGTDVGITGNPAALINRINYDASTLVDSNPAPVFDHTCLADVDFNAGTAYAIHLPLSKICQPLQWLGELGVGLSLLFSIMWIFTGV